MKLTRCEKKHFYDSDKYTSCPHCNKAVISAVSVGVPMQEGKKESTLGGNKNVSKRVESQESQEPPKLKDSVKTEAIIDGIGKINVGLENMSKQDDMALEADNVGEPIAENAQPLLASINAVRETVHYEETKTVAFYDNEAEPVVGWLVCVKGEYFGIGFPLKTGKNTIGRSPKMDVALLKEVSVSRDRHAILIYEPRKSQFFLQPGESNGLTYINDDLLMMPQEIHDYDVIQVGNGVFVFRTLCGNKFTWDTYMVGEK